MESLSNFTTRHSRGMKKYQAVIRLNNSINSSSYSDISTLNLTNLDESRSELDLTYHGEHVTTYYTIDSRRLGKHKKNQEEQKLFFGIKHFNLNVQKGLKILQEGGFVEKSSESVANFLFRQERLSKKQIGTRGKRLIYLSSLYFSLFREIFGRSWRFQQTSSQTFCSMPSVLSITASWSIAAVFVEFQVRLCQISCITLPINWGLFWTYTTQFV